MNGSGVPGQPPHRRLLGDQGHPYYVVTPKYVANSAGIRSLFMLGRALNSAGRDAYLTDIGLGGPDGPFAGDAAVPVLTADVAMRHVAGGRNPIVVYPEVVHGNPLRAGCVVRYVLNYPGLLFGPRGFAESEHVWAYSGVLGRAVGTSDVLSIPVCDPDWWVPLDRPRTGSLVYAPKFRLLGGAPAHAQHAGALEIGRDGPESDPMRIRSLLSGAELLYLYENSAIGIEAVLCGCPVVFMPNEHFTEAILADELGSDGFAWGPSDAEINRARATVGAARERYVRLFGRFWEDLDRFIETTQKAAESDSVPSDLAVDRIIPPGRRPPALPRKALNSLQDRGVRGLITDTRNWSRRRIGRVPLA